MDYHHSNTARAKSVQANLGNLTNLVLIEYALVSKVSYQAKTRHTMYLPKIQQCITSHANEMMGSAMRTFTVSN